MEQPTPTFCKQFLGKNGKSVHFSTFISNTFPKKIRKLSFENSEENDDDKKHQRKPAKSKKVHSRSKMRKISSKSAKHKNYKIKDSKKQKHISIKNSNKSPDNLNNFIKNHRFVLKDDFNEKNVNKFLSSKEVAFEIPIFLKTEIILK